MSQAQINVADSVKNFALYISQSDKLFIVRTLLMGSLVNARFLHTAQILIDSSSEKLVYQSIFDELLPTTELIWALKLIPDLKRTNYQSVLDFCKSHPPQIIRLCEDKIKSSEVVDRAKYEKLKQQCEKKSQEDISELLMEARAYKLADHDKICVICDSISRVQLAYTIHNFLINAKLSNNDFKKFLDYNFSPLLTKFINVHCLQKITPEELLSNTKEIKNSSLGCLIKVISNLADYNTFKQLFIISKKYNFISLKTTILFEYSLLRFVENDPLESERIINYLQDQESVWQGMAISYLFALKVGKYYFAKGLIDKAIEYWHKISFIHEVMEFSLPIIIGQLSSCSFLSKDEKINYFRLFIELCDIEQEQKNSLFDWLCDGLNIVDIDQYKASTNLLKEQLADEHFQKVIYHVSVQKQLWFYALQKNVLGIIAVFSQLKPQSPLDKSAYNYIIRALAMCEVDQDLIDFVQQIPSLKNLETKLYLVEIYLNILEDTNNPDWYNKASQLLEECKMAVDLLSGEHWQSKSIKKQFSDLQEEVSLKGWQFKQRNSQEESQIERSYLAEIIRCFFNYIVPTSPKLQQVELEELKAQEELLGNSHNDNIPKGECLEQEELPKNICPDALSSLNIAHLPLTASDIIGKKIHAKCQFLKKLRDQNNKDSIQSSLSGCIKWCFKGIVYHYPSSSVVQIDSKKYAVIDQKTADRISKKKFELFEKAFFDKGFVGGHGRNGFKAVAELLELKTKQDDRIICDSTCINSDGDELCIFSRYISKHVDVKKYVATHQIAQYSSQDLPVVGECTNKDDLHLNKEGL